MTNIFDINSVGNELSSLIDSIERISNDLIVYNHYEPKDIVPLIQKSQKLYGLIDNLIDSDIAQNSEKIKDRGRDVDLERRYMYTCFKAGINVGSLLPDLNAAIELNDIDNLDEYNINSFVGELSNDTKDALKALKGCFLFADMVKNIENK